MNWQIAAIGIERKAKDLKTMIASVATFHRWQNFEQTTWSFQVFSKYDDQLGMMLTANNNAAKYCYSAMGKAGCSWSDSAERVLATGDRFLTAFEDLKHWSNTYNDFQNWMRLNAVLATAANLETYIAGAIDTALQSDPGTLFGASKGFDGAKLLKTNVKGLDRKPHIISCTRGDWPSRISAMERIFGQLPLAAKSEISNLEKIRHVRNNVGHAFGREISHAQYHGLRKIHAMERITESTAFGATSTCRRFAKALDNHLLLNHIGDFEVVRFFHTHHQDDAGAKMGERIASLKKAIGKLAQPRGKTYLKDLISYWDQL